MIKIGKLKLKSRLILAPMAGISDLPFRVLNRKFGCELAFTEMLNASSLSHKSKKTQQMLFSDRRDKPLGVQILGNQREIILRALDVLRRYKFDILDFNAACPTRKVVCRGEGASLLRHPKKLGKIIKLLVNEVDVSVTVKIRTGWNSDSINARELACICQDSGASGIFIHGRTKEQGYSGTADYATIKKVKKAVSIPVIASGDILSAQLAKKMFDETNCDCLLVARGALGNPWIFKGISEFLKSEKVISRPSAEKIVKTMIEHLNMCVDFYGEEIAVKLFRKFFCWYTKGFPKIRPLREKFFRAKTKNDMLGIIESIAGS
ncbi:MAG: tRNA dihydrouridine synthase DusB [Candidatus Omnitrophica bacterium]|nr:tRNA dihydrouridine synthase DusB [Candidatus Omnitrophota bacterium]